MSGPKRNPDQLNTIGVVVVGICGAVLVYVSIVALQAFYLNDTSEIQTMADYGGNDVNVRSIKTSQLNNIGDYGSNPAAPGKSASYRVPIDLAMKKVVEAAKVDPAALVPGVRSDKATVQPIFGRPTPAAAPAGQGAGSADGAGAGSAAPDGGASAPQTPTGALGGGGSQPTSAGTQGGPPTPVGNLPPSNTGAGGASAGSAAKGNGP
ncbi:MAG: hypothetical protein JWP01_1353 [Myxococcales bacterium]|nr:hypothetical protein [Myxococcales bacterium]